MVAGVPGAGVYVADVHVGNHARHGGEQVAGLNERARLAVGALRGAAELARQQALPLVVLGDLFDVARPTPPLVRAAADAMLGAGEEVLILLGNHDLASTGAHDHALADMDLLNRVRVADKPRRTLGVSMVPYHPGSASEWLEAGCRALGPDSSGLGVLATHLGIWDDQTPPYLRASSDAVPIGLVRRLMREYGYRLVVAGNWHARRAWDVPEGRVVIPGALAPAGYGDDGECGFAMVLDRCGGMSWRSIPGPRFHRVVGVDELRALAPERGPGYRSHVRCLVRPDDRAEAMSVAEELRGVDGRVVVEVVLDDELSREAVTRAARAARAEDGVDAAVAAYAGRVKVRKPGTVDGVVARVRAYQRSARS